MTNERRQIINRLLRGAELNLRRPSEYWIGYFGKNPLLISATFGKHLVANGFVELAGGNDYYDEYHYVRSDKLVYNIKNLRFNIGDTVEYEGIMGNRLRGIITYEHDEMGLDVSLNGLTFMKYSIEHRNFLNCRMILIEKNIYGR